MKENYLIIHGSFGSPYNNWFPWLANELQEKQKEVIVPFFPSGIKHQNYNNWSQILDSYKACGLLNENTIIIAHSIGPVFITKYLILNKLKVQKLIFVSGFNNYFGISVEYDTVNKSFFYNKLEEIAHLVNERICIYSDNDPYLPLYKLQEFSKIVATKEMIISSGGHLNSENGYDKFPEILEFI